VLGLRRSALPIDGVPPAFSTSLTDSAPSASRRPATTTFAPCSAKATAVARPIPEVPPVINTTFLVMSSWAIVMLLLKCRFIL
jgi:hypothetical protein